MATLEKIRSKGGLLVTIIGLALLAFILGDLNRGIGGFSNRETVGKINGSEVKIADFNKEIDRMSEVYKVQTNQQQLSEEMQEQVRQTVWENLVHERVMNKEYKELGIGVSAKELFNLLSGDNISPYIQQIPMFQNPQKGGFDKELLLRFLNSMQLDSKDPAVQEKTMQARNYWLFWENLIKNSRLEEKYNTLLAKTMTANSLDAQYAIDATKRSVNAIYTMKPYSSIADSLIAVSSGELKAEYEKIKNRYETDASREAKYIVFEVKPNENDVKQAEEYIQKYKEEFATTGDVAGLLLDIQSDVPYTGKAVSLNAIDPDFKNFAASGKAGDVSPVMFSNDTYKIARIINNGISSPDSVKLNRIALVSPTEARTKALADSLMRELRAGEDFGYLAQQFSIAPSAQDGGEEGWITEAALDNEELIEACFRGSSNLFLFTPPASTGAYIIQIEARTKPVRKVKLAVLQRAVEASDQTTRNIYNKASLFVAQNNTLEKFEKAAKAQNLEVRSYGGIKENDPRIAGFRDTRKAVQWLYNNSTGDVSSDVYPNSNNTNFFFVLAVGKIQPKGPLSLEDLDNEVRQRVLTDKKAEQISNDFAQKLKASHSLAALGLPIDTLKDVNFASSNLPIGNEPRLVGALTASKVGEVSAPLKGERGVFVYEVTNETIALGGVPVEVEKQILNQQNSRISYGYYEALKKAAKITDSRSKFY